MTVLRTVPFAPTAQPVVALTKYTSRSDWVVPLFCAVHWADAPIVINKNKSRPIKGLGFVLRTFFITVGYWSYGFINRIQ